MEWSNDIFSALNVNAQDIGGALERIGKVDTPGDADASASSLAAGQVWSISSCKDSEGSRSCTAGFGRPPHTLRTLIAHGTGARNATSANITGSNANRLTHNMLISGNSWDELVVIVRHAASTRTYINRCVIPGIQGDWLANATNPLTLQDAGGVCRLTVPASGALTLQWDPPLSGNKLLGDSWRLYGVKW